MKFADYSPSPESFVISAVTSFSLTLSWTIPFHEVAPDSFSLSYTINKYTGAAPTTANDSLSIPYNDTGLSVTGVMNFSYVLGGLTAYTEYSFSLASVYGSAVSSEVDASANTTEGSK